MCRSKARCSKVSRASWKRQPRAVSRVMGRATYPSGSCSSEGSVLWLELPLLSSPLGSPPPAGVPCGGAWGTSSWGTGEGCLLHSTSCWDEGKSPAAPAPGVGVPAPRVNGGTVSPSGSTILSPCGVVDASQGERVGKGSSNYVQCI